MLPKVYPGSSPMKLTVWAGQLWSFRDRIAVDDIIALPLKKQAAIALGRVSGPYEYHASNPPGTRHARPVEWIRKDVPRSTFESDLLFSLGSTLTVCQIKRNDAEKRIRAMLGAPGRVSESIPTATLGDEAVEPLDVEEYASDRVRDFVGRRFKGHALARLTSQILQAQGYHTLVSPEGADGGIDIIAGRGPMGFDSPRLCVQVKSSDDPLDSKPLRELQGVMHNYGAEQGLLVSWGGFKPTVHKESRQLYFKVRLWDAGEFVKNLLEYYDKLPADIQAELPLKRIWALVEEELES